MLCLSLRPAASRIVAPIGASVSVISLQTFGALAALAAAADDIATILEHREARQ
jgi:hypothetical protein